MSKARNYEKIICQMDWPELKKLWQQIKHKQTPKLWPPGKALEYFLLRCFQLEGAEVVYPLDIYKQNEVIEQLDGIIFWNNYVVLVECKDTSRPINFDPIAKLRSRLMTRPNNVIGCFFSMSGYTVPAQIVSEHLAPQTILLWGASDIDYSIENGYFCEGLNFKFKQCVIIGRPDFKLSNRSIDE